jgi:Predicted dehydrogenases and related proteins
MPSIFWPPPAIPKLIKICGRNEQGVKEASIRYGYMGYCTDWHEIVNDNQIEIFVNGGINNIHAEPCIEAAKNGKHIVCEKPLARNAAEAKKMLDAVLKAKIKHICNFNYRQVPVVALAKKLVMEGKIGKIYHFRKNYLQEWAMIPDIPLSWHFDKNIAGSGVVGGLSHIIDLARWLCDEPESIIALTKTFIKERTLMSDSSKKGKVTVEDAFIGALEFKNGAIGLIEGSNVCQGRKNFEVFEINGELGSIYWNLEDSNYLNVYYKKEKNSDTKGFHRVSVAESYHPYYNNW